MAKGKSTKAPNFEKALNALEELVENLEEGDLPLEEYIDQIEKSTKLALDCQVALKSAHQRVNVLMEENNKILESLADSEFDEEE